MMTETVGAVRKVTERSGEKPPVILAVTVLTSLNDGDLQLLGFKGGTRDTALHLARLAQDAGVSGVVASAEDAAAIRKACGGKFWIVTPGIRGAKEVADEDQKRIVTPAEAVSSGADYLVVGRPIRQAADPAGEADAITKEIVRGLALRDGR
jgi:orotidine-5'-phosphate decarboxylase